MDNQQLPYSSGQPSATGGAPVPGGAAGPPPVPHHHLLQQQQAQLQAFWAYQRQEAERASASDFKNHQLPLARIKKIMKADEDVRMISAEAPVLFAKACELFILELTIRSWLHAEENKRRTLQRNDVAATIARTDVFDFLVDIVPREEAKEEPGSALGFAAGGAVGAGAASGAPAAGMPYYYPPMGQPASMTMPACKSRRGTRPGSKGLRGMSIIRAATSPRMDRVLRRAMAGQLAASLRLIHRAPSDRCQGVRRLQNKRKIWSYVQNE